MGTFGLTKRERQIWQYIRVGDKATLRVLGEQDDPYHTSVQAVTFAYIDVLTPNKGNVFLELPRKKKVEVELEICNILTGRVIFVSRVRMQEWMEKKTMRIEAPRSLKWIQLRKFYRIETICNVEYSVVNLRSPEKGLGLTTPVFFGITRNLSETGGMLIVDRVADTRNEVFLNMRIQLSSKISIRARARVTRVEKLKTNGKYGLAMEFVMFPQEEREKLRRFIFEKGREEYLKRK